MAEELGFLTDSLSVAILSALLGALILLFFFVPRKKEDDAKQKPSGTGKEEETAPKDRQEDRDMTRQHPSSHQAATRQGERTNARDVDVPRTRTYPVAARDGLFLQYASSAEDALQKPSTDAICSATRHSAGQLADTSPLRRRTHDLYDHPLRYVLSPQEPHRCGYPRLCPEKTGRVLFVQGGGKPYSSRKTCSRCRASFVITHSGEYCAAKSACFFHTGRCTAIGFSGCGVSADHPGCDSSHYHVCPLGTRDKWDTAALAFVCSRRRHSGAREVVALDCEVCFTIRGFEVARVSEVECNGTTLYDSYVRPGSPVLDYNTAFRGITTAHLRNVHTTLQLQGTLLRLFNAPTVLIGHGLENDLRVLRQVYYWVADVAVVFSHYRNLRYRRSLRPPVGGNLNHGGPNGLLGHDCVEDDKACMELMPWQAAGDQDLRDRLSRWTRRRQGQLSE